MAISVPENPLCRLPPEIRNLIYIHSLSPKDEWQGNLCNTPDRLVILSLLRPVTTLYEEALAVFYNVNSFILNGETFPTFKKLNTKAISSIRNLVITVT